MSRYKAINPADVAKKCQKALNRPITMNEFRLLKGAADPMSATLLNRRQLWKARGVAANVICTPIDQRLQAVLARGPITDERLMVAGAGIDAMDFSINLFGKAKGKAPAQRPRIDKTEAAFGVPLIDGAMAQGKVPPARAAAGSDLGYW